MPRLALRATLRKKSVGAKSAPCGSRDGRPVSQTIFSGRLPLALFAVRGEVVVQFWLKPGETAVTLGVGEEREVERIPEQLKRFL